MRVALIGATGYVGAAVSARLIDDGHHVIRLIRNPDPTEAATASVTTVTGNALDADAVDRTVASADAVIHALGSADVATARPPPSSPTLCDSP